MTGTAENLETYLAAFEQLEKIGGDGRPSWIRTIRREAMQRFVDLGFPTTRDEEWKYTNVAPVARVAFERATSRPVDPADLAALPFANVQGGRLVLVNGRFDVNLSSLPRGLKAGSLAGVLDRDGEILERHLTRYASYRDHPFVALNTAFLDDGAFLRIPKGMVAETPVHILYISVPDGRPAVTHPRAVILAEPNSQATIIESYVSLGGQVSLTNAVTEIVVGENAVIEHCKLQCESLQAFHVATLQVRQNRTSNFTSHSISLGAALVRNDVNTVLDGEGVECTLNGLYLTGGTQHVDNHTVIDHARPHCSSHELYKGILDGRSTGVFNGKIFVRKDAQKTDAKQTNKNLLLSDDATINTKPQLEINADDVKCTHGATIGQLDPEALFYLRSRGIGRQEARDLLTYAFARDIVERIRIPVVRERLEHSLFAHFSGTGSLAAPSDGQEIP